MILRIAWLIVGSRALSRARSAAQGRVRTMPGTQGRLARRTADLYRDARIAAQAFTLLVYLAAAAALITAGTSTAVLSPKWLGAILLVLGAAALVAAVLEGRRLRQAVLRRRLQRRDEALRKEL
ncbi:MAG: hypothetical protein ABR532_05990 [Candidatus Dormibacteria bacterium]